MYVVGITGGTASGKSTFLELLKKECQEKQINFISQDDYYKDTSNLCKEQRASINFDHPSSLDFELLHQHLVSLTKGTSIHKPKYSFASHNRLSQTEIIYPLPLLVLEGILILSDPKIKALCSTTIFIDAPEDIRLDRRIKRDTIERGRTEESVRLQFKKFISPMHQQFIEPLKKEVNYVFDGAKNFKTPIKLISQLIQQLNSIN